MQGFDYTNHMDASNCQIYRITPTVPDFNIDFQEYSKAFKCSAKPDKAAGPDGIKSNHLKLIRADCFMLLNRVSNKNSFQKRGKLRK